MSRKTVKLDESVYGELDEANRDDESFSDTVSRLLEGYEPFPYDEFYIQTHDDVEEMKARIDALEKQIDRLPNRLLSELRTA